MNVFLRPLPACILASAALCLTIASCSDSDDAPKSGDPVSRSIELTETEKAASTQSNVFAWQLLEKTPCGIEENAVLSPISANICLSMLANATAGESRAQLLDALGFSDKDMADVNSLNHKLAKDICGLDANVTLAIANSFWYDKNLNPKDGFTKDMRDNYNIESYIINHKTFVKDVNKWCSDHTKGLIPRILDNDVYEDFALMNAIYFKGIWNSEYKFLKSLTYKDLFSNADGSESKVDYMCKQGLYSYHRDENWRAMSIPFGGGGYRFTVVLPDEGYSIDDCMATIKKFEPATGDYQTRPLELKLPRFKMNKETNLIEVLKSLGVYDIFDINLADFKNLTDYAMVIDLAKQCVSFEINEEGAEAAAVTIVGGVLTAIDAKPVYEYEPFYVNKPFIFMISEKSTGAILFMGRINKF